MNALNENLLEQVLDGENLRAAWLAVKANRGAPGIDGIGIDKVLLWPNRTTMPSSGSESL